VSDSGRAEQQPGLDILAVLLVVVGRGEILDAIDASARPARAGVSPI
jgi:hypothetical protein